MTTGPIPIMLAQQTPSGNWAGDPGYYGPKYVGTHWSLLLLAELDADREDAGIQRGVDFILNITEKNYMLEGRFQKTVPSPQQFGLTCFWGNVLRYAAHFHRAHDPRIAPIVDYIERNSAAGECRCIYNEYLPCAWGVARALWGLAALPDRSAQVQAIIERGVDFLLRSGGQLVGGNYPTSGNIHKMWAKLNFPLFYQVDVLFILRVLAELGALDHPGAQPALDWLADQRQPHGRWRGSSPYRSRTWRITGDDHDTSRWVSLQAALILRRAGRTV
jgi:hypothetical protein